jgi:hypothetical protein
VVVGVGWHLFVGSQQVVLSFLFEEVSIIVERQGEQLVVEFGCG